MSFGKKAGTCGIQRAKHPLGRHTQNRPFSEGRFEAVMLEWCSKWQGRWGVAIDFIVLNGGQRAGTECRDWPCRFYH